MNPLHYTLTELREKNLFVIVSNVDQQFACHLFLILRGRRNHCLGRGESEPHLNLVCVCLKYAYVCMYVHQRSEFDFKYFSSNLLFEIDSH